MAPVFDHFLILDFETTSYGSNFDYPFEIIQFSVAVVDARTKRIRTDVSFNKYVRPVINPILTEHCQSFTGIEQKSLNEADLFQDVYYQFLRWLSNNNFIEKKFVMVCDSRQDLWRIAQWQFRYCGIIMPPFFRQYVNLWRTFEWEQERLGTKVLVKDTNIGKMCEYYNVEFIGRAHDALNDVLNLALVVEKMLESGAHITVNEELVCRTVVSLILFNNIDIRRFQ
uniref:Exonuclease domain-containing protein n=2 Tax=Caenorhabditis japonica TaxID=281687 RepID=A0A8R1I5J5_CAEJA